MTEIKLGAATLQMLLAAIDRAEKDADRIEAATNHDQLPLIPNVVDSIRSLCQKARMAIGGDG